MSAIFHSTAGYWVISCERCPTRHVGELKISRASMSEEAELALLGAIGWRVFVGRGRRYYCPDCGPSSEGMRLVAAPRDLEV